MSLNVLVFDDQGIVRAGFAAVIDAEEDMTVVGEAADGVSAVRLAEQLGIAVGTVKSHVTALLRKLGLRDRVQATILAYDLGLATPNPPRAHL
ncbi:MULTISPECIES: response regulator transcription factor [unclassified Streptomyces]|uniref:response regulator transcription factor n=1 Tax=unclassified Streptomyces TaxID=2593676 RepID=UPI000BF00E3F|nr:MULTISPECIES: DNA-binding response regulator [unclassified Streptomyces]